MHLNTTQMLTLFSKDLKVALRYVAVGDAPSMWRMRTFERMHLDVYDVNNLDCV